MPEADAGSLYYIRNPHNTAQKSAGAFGGGDEVRRGTDSQQLEYCTVRNLLPFQRKISSTISSLSST